MTRTAAHRSFTSALVAWLVALGAAQTELDLAGVSEICIALCHVLAIFAPHFLSPQDFPSARIITNKGRQGRLALGLAEWFVANSRPPSPEPGDPDETGPVVTPASIPDGIKNRIDEITNAASNDAESADTLVALGECMLFAAFKSSEKQRFVEAIVSLSDVHQDELAHSVLAIDSTFKANDPGTVLTEADSNRENAPPTSDVSAKLMIGSNPSTPRGISFEEMKTLAEERDSLRRMLTVCENEKKSAVQVAEHLRRDFEAASDSLRSMQKNVATLEEELGVKNDAVLQAKNALRDMHMSDEEIDILRVQAASTGQLEQSLKQASSKLKEVTDLQKTVKNLEDENANHRDNEEYMSKKIYHLESQLSASNERAETLVHMSDELSLSLEAKTGEVRDINSKNRELSQKLETSLDQLAQILMQPSLPVAACTKPETFHDVFAQMASRKLNEELGVQMTWTEMVTCIQNVVVAMSEMEQKPQEDRTHEDRDIIASEQNYEEAEVRVLSDFAIIDSREMEREVDDYDYAMDHPGMSRRLSQLSTVPEDREGFSSDEEDDVPEPEIIDIPGATNVAEEFDSSSIHSNSQNGDVVQPQTVSSPVNLPRDDAPQDEAEELQADSVEPGKDALGLLVQHMMDARADAEKHRAEARKVERELEALRRNLDVMMKDHDASVNKWRDLRSRDAEVVREKDRSIELLEYTLAGRDEDLKTLRVAADDAKATAAQIRALEARLDTAAEEHANKTKGMEAEISQLTAKLSAAELIADRLSMAVEKTDGVTQEIHREHQACIRDMMEAARREKNSAQQAWAEAQRVADDCQRALTELVNSQASMAEQARSENSSRRNRCSFRVGAFCRRMFNRERIDAPVSTTADS